MAPEIGKIWSEVYILFLEGTWTEYVSDEDTRIGKNNEAPPCLNVVCLRKDVMEDLPLHTKRRWVEGDFPTRQKVFRQGALYMVEIREQ